MKRGEREKEEKGNSLPNPPFADGAPARVASADDHTASATAGRLFEGDSHSGGVSVAGAEDLRVGVCAHPVDEVAACDPGIVRLASSSEHQLGLGPLSSGSLETHKNLAKNIGLTTVVQTHPIRIPHSVYKGPPSAKYLPSPRDQ